MLQLRLGCLIVLAALYGAPLCAQLAGPEIDISYVEAPGSTKELDVHVLQDTAIGTWIMVWNYPVEMRFKDRSAPDVFNRVRERSFRLLADRAVLWFKPDNAAQSDNEPAADDAAAAFARGISKVQFYAEGQVLMEYGYDATAMKVRAQQIYLEFEFGEEDVKDNEGKPVIDTETGKPKRRLVLKKLKGRASEVRAHSGADELADRARLPVPPGIGIGAAAEEAADPESQGNIGAAPSDDAVPEPGGPPRSLPQERGQRLFLRAKQMALDLDFARDVQEVNITEGSITSSSLAVPSYSLSGTKLTLRLTPVRRTAYVTRPSIRVLDYPLLTLPLEYYSYDLDSEFPIRQLDFLTSQRFGFAIRSYVDLISAYDFFVDPEPPFRPLQLGPQIDWFSRRGLGVGLNLDWGGVDPFDKFARASMRSIYIEDSGDDRDRARELGWFPLEKRGRGRLLAHYSQYFGGGIQLDHMLNYETDRNFRREFYEPEYDRNEPIDSFIRLTKRSGHLNYFLHIEPRVHPWQSKTEYLPQVGFEAMRAPVGDFGLQLSSHTSASVLRFSPGEHDQRDPTYVPRLDSNTWFNLPFELGPLAVDPFAGARFTLAHRYLEIPEGTARPTLDEEGNYPGLRSDHRQRWGYLYRFMPAFGVNLQTFLTGTFPGVRIPALGIHGLRHVFAPYVRYVNVAYNSLDDIDGRAFIPLDPIDVLDEFHEVRIGFRNRLQTRTGRNEHRRTSDYFEVMAEIPLYPQRLRDNGGRTFGLLEIASVWRPAPSFALAGNMFIDIYTGNVERAAASFRFDVPNFGQGSIYYRLLKHQHQVVGAQLDLTLSEAYRIRLKQEYDLEGNRLRDTRVELYREVLEAFDIGVAFVRDAVDGDIGFYGSISATFRAPRGGASLLR